jgi:hypothetical protein
MLLKEILAEFETPRQAAEIGRMGYRLALRWYEPGLRRLIPPIHVLVAWADFHKLTDASLGELIRDGELERRKLSRLLQNKSDRERSVEVKVERHRQLLDRELRQTRYEEELALQASEAELSELDKQKQNILESQRRVSALVEQQRKLLQEIKK